MADTGSGVPTSPVRPAPALLLVTTRPTIEDASGRFLTERVLEENFCASRNVTEWCLPAFSLRVRTEAIGELRRWLDHPVETLPNNRGAPGTVRQTAGARSSTTPSPPPGAVSTTPVAPSCPFAAPALPDLVVVVSPGSLALLRPHLPDPWPAGLALGLMGDGSAAKAVALGIPAQALIHPQQALGQGQDSAGLLTILRQRNGGQPAFGRILLLQGDRGNQELGPALQACCSALTLLHAYHRQAQVVSDQQIERLRAHSLHNEVWFYLTSSEAAAVMAPAVLACKPSSVRVWATHTRIEQAAHRAGLPNVQAVAPGAAVLRARIAQWGE